MFRSVSLRIAASLVLAAHGVTAAAQTVSLAISKELAPPGAAVQVKVFTTEPQPVSTGGGHLTFSAYDSVLGIDLSPAARDAFGVAVVRGNDIALSIVSPSASFGTSVDYPLLAVAGRVAAGAPMGTKFPLALDPASLQLTDPTGALYAIEVKQGHVVVGNSVAIGDVNPGSANLQAGDIVTVTGANFVPETTIKFSEATISQVRYISPTRLDVVLGSSAQMHGMRIKASNPDGTASTYYSYQRVFPMALSTDPIMQLVEPLMPDASAGTLATIALPPAGSGTSYGVALKNLGTATVQPLIQLLDGSGHVLASTSLAVDPNRFAVRSCTELFGDLVASGSAVRVTSVNPIQMLGIVADQTTGTARPIVPQF